MQPGCRKSPVPLQQEIKKDTIWYTKITNTEWSASTASTITTSIMSIIMNTIMSMSTTTITTNMVRRKKATAV